MTEIINSTPLEVERLWIEDLISNVTSKLTGSSDSYERLVLPNYPQKLIILGSLAEEDPSFVDNDSTSVKNNSLTIMFLTRGDVCLKVKPLLSLYYGVKEAEGELKLHGLNEDKHPIPFVWKRLRTHFPYFELSKDKQQIELNFEEYISKIKQDKEHNEFYKRSPVYNWQGVITLEIENYSPTGEIKLVKIRFINKTQKLTKSERIKYVTSFFNCSLELKLDKIPLIEFIDKRKNEFGTIEEIRSIFKTFNCDFKYFPENNEVKTIAFKRFDQPQILPRLDFEYQGKPVEPLFSKLKDSLLILDQLHTSLKEYLEMYKSSPQYQTGEDFTKTTNNYEKVIQRFKEGIDCLNSNEKAEKAFKLMQLTFENYTQDKSYHGWRIFQIVFIVSLIPDIIFHCI